MVSSKRRKGISTLIGAIIAIGLLVIVFGTVIQMVTAASYRMSYKMEAIERLSKERELENVVVKAITSVNNTKITITNNGSSIVLIKWLEARVGDKLYMIDMYSAANNASNLLTPVRFVNATAEKDYLIIRIGGLAEFEGQNIDPIALVTATGNVIKIEKISESTTTEFAQTAGAVVVYPVTLGANLLNRTDITVDPDELTVPTEDNLGAGMKTYGYHYVVVATYKNVSVYATSLHFGNLIVGYSPDWTMNRVGPPKYDILVTGPYYPGSYFYTTLKVGSDTYRLDYQYSAGWRVKIIGFRPNTDNDLYVYYRNDAYDILKTASGSDTLGMWFYGSPATYSEGYVKLIGTADEVRIYRRAPGEYEFSYEPYFITADTDGNGNPEYLFITEDLKWGHADSLNDALTNRCYYSWRIYDDWSVKPFFINLTGYTIDSTKIALVTVAFRIYFHDNVGDDIDEISSANRWLIGVYLIDADTGDVAEVREYNYQELSVLEDTYPPNTNYLVQTVTMLLPNNGHKYFIAFGFQDPYSDACKDPEAAFGTNDGDFSIGIEWLGISFYARPPS